MFPAGTRPVGTSSGSGGARRLFFFLLSPSAAVGTADDAFDFCADLRDDAEEDNGEEVADDFAFFAVDVAFFFAVNDGNGFLGRASLALEGSGGLPFF